MKKKFPMQRVPVLQLEKLLCISHKPTLLFNYGILVLDVNEREKGIVNRIVFELDYYTFFNIGASM